MKAVVDNDILLKGACYGLLSKFLGCIPGSDTVGVLGAARFVVSDRIARAHLNGNREAAQACFAAFLAASESMEPSSEECQMAGLLEASAQRTALNLDVGESQLVAMLVSRTVPILFTGDKRAIAALEILLDEHAWLQFLYGKVRCLEQLLLDILATNDEQEVRTSICKEPSVDKALTICFACASPQCEFANVLEGLSSYINDLRAKSKRILST
jgi:hypothetical protein